MYILRVQSAIASNSRYWVMTAIVFALIALPVLSAFPQNSSQSAITIEGTVRNSAGEPVSDATVLLEEKMQTISSATRTNADGTFILMAPHAGTYILKAQKSGWRDAVKENLGLSAGKIKVNLILEDLREAPSSASNSGTMEFEDKPNFTVAGVTDSTQAGGHGSDAGARTSEALARETVTLKPSGANEITDQLLSDDIADRKPFGPENELQAALAQGPGSFEANRRLGEFYFLSRKYAEAIPLFEAACQINPENHANGYDLALSYRENGDYAKAREQVRKMLAKTDKAELHSLLGNLDERLGDPLEAVQEYEQATHMDPSEQNYFDWGTELLLHRAVAPATEVFTKGSNLHPDSVRMLAGLGAALYAGGFYDQAAARVCAASDLKPADPEPYLFLGRMEETAPAPLPCVEQKIARFVQNQPGNALAHYYFALALLKRAKESGDLAISQPAVALLEKAVTIDPKLGQAHMQLGILYYGRGQYEQAIHAYQKAVEGSPQLSEAHYRLGVAYKRMGDPAKAQQEFQTQQQVEKTEAAAVERQRREVQQFLIVLKNHPVATPPK